MPYIIPSRRPAAAVQPETVGELNYAITALIVDYLRRKGGVSYALVNDALGALEGAKQEFYRRVAAPYEDIKRSENGDVYAPLHERPEDDDPIWYQVEKRAEMKSERA